jgi:glycogen synthase kinase 3 beta
LNLQILCTIANSLSLSQVFRKAEPNAIDLISRLLEYTPTQRLSAVEAMVHPFFDELRDPNTRLLDSRHANGGTKELPPLFDFSLHGELAPFPLFVDRLTKAELSIRPDLNQQLVPPHARAALKAKGIDIDSPNFQPMKKEDMIARLD